MLHFFLSKCPDDIILLHQSYPLHMHYPSLTPAGANSSWALRHRPPQQHGHRHGHRQGRAVCMGTMYGAPQHSNVPRMPPCPPTSATPPVTLSLLQGARTMQQISILCLFLCFFPRKQVPFFHIRGKEPEKLGEMATLGSSPQEGCGYLPQCCRLRLPLPTSGTSLALGICLCSFPFLHAA